MMFLPVISYTLYHSSNSYIGTVLLRRVLRRFDSVELVRRPILVPRSMGVKMSDMLDGKENRNAASYGAEDNKRWAERYRIPFKQLGAGTFNEWARRWATAKFEREELAARAFYAAEPAGRDALDNALFEAVWVEGLDVNEESTIRWAAARAELDPDRLWISINDGAGAVEAWAAVEDFLAAECPGVPTVMIRGERFFGKDRVDWIFNRCKELTAEARE